MSVIRFFNTTGPCEPEYHYMLSPEECRVGAQLHRYIRDRLYWVLHAPRQTGKTTLLKSLMREINKDGTHTAFHVSVEVCQGVTDVNEAINIIRREIVNVAQTAIFPEPVSLSDVSELSLADTLKYLSRMVTPKPLVMFFDHVEVLEDDPLVHFTSMLRTGFTSRGVGEFPVSVALAGRRDPKDYITVSKDDIAPKPGMPFNIKEDSAVIGNFSRNDVACLFGQRTAETGQRITPEALNYVYEQSKGQPWIVNSLFKRATMRVLDEESTETVTVEHVAEARQQMIRASETHFDIIAYRMKNPAVRRAMEILISGEPAPSLTDDEGFRLCMASGFVTIDGGTPRVVNPIYEEIVTRYLNSAYHDSIPPDSWQRLSPEGDLDADGLLKDFQKFWRRHSEIWEQKSDYTEAFPHLLLMAFLQRVLNGGGRIEREYAAGRGRMDLAVEYNGKWQVVEVKIVHDYETPRLVENEGLEQIRGYRDRIDPQARSYLVIFDRRSKALQLPWDDRIQWRTEGDVTVVGC